MSLFLNLLTTEHDKQIYRIISYHRLLELFSDNKNSLVHPSCWDDPYENFVLRSKVRRASGAIEQYDYHKNVYGQCWTLNKASDAMWRIYSSNGDGIRIRTTIRTLLSSLYHGGSTEPSRSCTIGRVQYLSEKALKRFANSVYQDGTLTKDSLFKSLLVKRKAFSHEKEIRLLYFDLDGQENGKIFRHDIDPHSLIDQIMLDPRLSRRRVDELRASIREQTNFAGRILRSGLYAAPEEIVLGDPKS